MRRYPDPSDFIVAVTALGLILLLSIKSLYHAFEHFFKHRQHKLKSEIYQDDDGTATIESSEAFSDRLPRLAPLIISALGSIVSAFFLAGSFLGALCFLTGDKDSCQERHNSIWIEQCFVLQSWVFIFVQSCILFRTPDSVARFRLGLWGSASSAILAVSLPVEAIQWIDKKHTFSASALHATLLLIEFGLALVLALLFLSLPRRPDVFYDGKPVDRQHTVTALSRATFDWATPILLMTAKKRNIDHSDLPVVSYDSRARTLRRDFDDVGKKDKFWKALAYSHGGWLIAQWTIQTIQSFANFLPQIVLYAILRTLEARNSAEENRFQLWLLVLALGFSDAIFSWTESWLYYICYLKLGSRIYEQISTVIFNKAIRKKDVKGVAKTDDEGDNKIAINEAAGAKGEDTVHEDRDADEGTAKTKQSTINLIGVDGKRIADFTVYNSMLAGCVTKVLIAIALLVGLIGWIPMLSGFSIFIVMAPLNYWVATYYTAAQDDLMKYRDQKMAVITEALQGIRQIKFSALEKDWYDKILKTRKKELRTQWSVFMYDNLLLSMWGFGPACLSALSLTVYAIINKSLSASVAFTTIAIFDSIEVALGVAPELLTDLFDALVSCRRIQEYLDSPDRDSTLKTGNSIVFQDATVSWPSDEKVEDKGDEHFRLRDLNIDFPLGELSVISGRTGSGKSLLLSSIIGEAEVTEGSVHVPRAPQAEERFDHKAHKSNWLIKDAIAFVAQIPWIENATIKDNILFGLPLDSGRYKQVLYASALEKDMEILQDGDLTDIGANGINLSGGQKWRVSFARALYSRAGILVLDDIFSAVDAHVGKHLFEEALTGELGRGRTRILVTHHVSLCLPRTKYSVLLENGTVLQAGLTEELRRNGLLKDILAYDIEEQKKSEEQTDKDQAVMVDDGGSLQKILSARSGQIRRESGVSNSALTLTRTRSAISEHPISRGAPKKFTDEEKREVGAVKLSIYKAYINASGGFPWWIFVVVIYLTWTASFMGKSYWVSVWTRASDTASRPVMTLLQQPAHHFHTLKSELAKIEVQSDVRYYVGIYIAISLFQWLIGTFKYFLVYVGSIKASKRLFENLTYTVLRAPLRFLDTTPVGRILNRFTADFNMIDSRISYDVMFTMHSLVSAIAVIAAGVLVSPLTLLFAFILVVGCGWFALRYLAGARELKRLESNAKSPVFEQFGSVLQGIGTIRAFGKAEEYVDKMDRKINTHCQAYYHLWLFNRWMGLRVAWVGALFLTAMGVLIVGLPNIDASLAGFALSFSLQLSECIIWFLRQYANLELEINAVERIEEYSKMPTETQSGHDAPAAWPTKGELVVDDLVVSYAPDLPPVLRGLTFSVKPNERVGVVGRTGAGKSSLTLALFRFLQAQAGSIWIDGIDISKIKLFDLRSRLAIIPQDPVLFSGTVRSNLDPFNQHTDTELRDALVRVHLIPSASALPSGAVTPSNTEGSSDSSTLGQGSTNINIFTSLSSKISEGGLNLSQGQRQLLCLARAIVSRPKILVLDEATSSVDMETDALIQRSIREEFADSTLIVIAHRLSTIADFDRILVLGEGKVLEFDEPESLMSQEDSAFRDMVQSSGERRELEAVIRGKQQR